MIHCIIKSLFHWNCHWLTVYIWHVILYKPLSMSRWKSDGALMWHILDITNPHHIFEALGSRHLLIHCAHIKPCNVYMGVLSSCCLTNSIFQYTHYGMWTPQHCYWRALKWMQQFHLKVTSRYYNKKQNIFHSWSFFLFLRLFLSYTDTLFLLLAKFKQEDIHCVCVMHLQERKYALSA